MLFDLSNPRRKNVLRVIYALLALLFAVGFVGFGIGGEMGGGGIVDSLTGGGGSTADQYEQQIDDAEETLEQDPQNANALSALAQYRYLSGQAQLEVDEGTGAPAITDDARSEFEAAVDAWNRYLDTEPRRPDVGTAGNVAQAFLYLDDVGGAAEAYEFLAEANPSVGTLATLAQYRYYDLDVKGGDRAIAELEKEKGGRAKQALEQLGELREQVVKEKRRLAQLPEGQQGESALQSPFGGLSPEGGAVPPAAP